MAKTVWPLLFVVVALVHLALIGLDAGSWTSVSKCFLAPTLIAWVLSVRGPRLLAWALVGCFFGDLFLELGEAWFVPGMAAFAVAHVCLVTIFVRRGAWERLREKPWVVGLYLVPAVALVVWAWPGLAPDLLVPVPVYAALLLATAATSAVVDRLAGVGGLLFLVSDGIIALGEADRVPADAVATTLAVMTLYCAAIGLLTAGILRQGAPRGR